MNDDKDDDQKKHESIKNFLKAAGILTLGIGIVFLIIGAIDFFSAFGSFDMPSKFWCFFIGIPLLGIGGAMTSFGFRREMTRYMKNESMPVIKEASEEIKPAIMNITSAVKAGLKENQVLCKCGKTNDKESKFCNSCGRALRKTCPACKAALSADSRFCDNCGYKL